MNTGLRVKTIRSVRGSCAIESSAFWSPCKPGGGFPEARRFPRERTMRLKPNDRGFSLLELMITLTIILIMTGVTFIAMQPMIKQNDSTIAFDTTLEVIRSYRNQAITKSRRYMITFTPAAGPVRATMTIQW